MRTSYTILAAVMSITLALPRASLAQARFEFTPFAGLYLPTADVIDEFDPTFGQVMVRHKTAFAFGSRIGLWVSRRVALEGALAYSPSGIEAEVEGAGTADTTANVLTWSAHVLFALGQPGANTSFFLTGGFGFVSHGGDGWDEADATTHVGPIVGVSVRFKVTPSLALRLDAEDRLYSAKFKDPDSSFETDSKFQNDLSLSLGLSVPLGRR